MNFHFIPPWQPFKQWLWGNVPLRVSNNGGDQQLFWVTNTPIKRVQIFLPGSIKDRSMKDTCKQEKRAPQTKPLCPQMPPLSSSHPQLQQKTIWHKARFTYPIMVFNQQPTIYMTFFFFWKPEAKTLNFGVTRASRRGAGYTFSMFDNLRKFYFSRILLIKTGETIANKKLLCVWSFVLSAFKMAFVYGEMGICHKHHSGIVEGGFIFSLPLFYSLAQTKEPRLLLYLELSSKHSPLCGARWLISAGFRGRWQGGSL